MSCVHKVGWLSNHTSVNPPSPFRLRLLRNTAVETQPELTHVFSPRPQQAPPQAPDLQTGDSTKPTLKVRNGCQNNFIHCAFVLGV